MMSFREEQTEKLVVKKDNQFLCGFMDSIPLAVGYFSVSFAFGILAVAQGINPWVAMLISLTNLTSAGQVAGVSIISAGGGLIEQAIIQFVINIRYALMGISLSQKLDESFRVPQRMLCAFGVTDEIFAVLVGKKEKLSSKYVFGMIIMPFLGWGLGTLVGGLAGNILPAILKDALGIALYGMFIAVLVPPAKQQRSILSVIIISIALSCLFRYLPLFSFLSSGFSVIICAVIAAALGAVFAPLQFAEESE